MGIIKFIPYIYLVAAAFFLYDGIDKLNSGEGNYWMSLILAAVATFMFFFRLRFAKKFEERRRNPNQ
ncbi:MAG: hypothetical protein IR153_02325 [Flavobacterium sp.]|nr:hypothetical protein [Flavobacterium sp.]